jgi:hypothetical protein
MSAWILLLWTVTGPATIGDTYTFEECKARALRHVSETAPERKALCVRRDGGAIVQIEPQREGG